MAKLESSLLPEEAKSVRRDCNLNNNHHEAFVPIIAEDITDGALVGLSCSSQGECGLKDGTYPSKNLIVFCPDEKAWEISDAKNAALGLKSGHSKEILNSNVLVDPKDLVPMDLIENWGQGVDVESGREINSGSGCDGSFWGSAKRHFGKALNSLNVGQSFNGSTNTVEPTFCFNAKVGLSEDPLKSGVANLSQKSESESESECNNVENPTNIGVLGLGKLRNGNACNNIKASSKKPPRPPRPPRQAKTTVDPSKEKLVKSILRRVKLERMATLKKKQIARSKSSSSSVWALAFTLCFCVIMIMQGIFSQGNSSAKISPEAAVQTSRFSMHKYDTPAVNGEPWHPITIELDQPSASLYHFRAGMDKTRLIETDPKS